MYLREGPRLYLRSKEVVFKKERRVYLEREGGFIPRRNEGVFTEQRRVYLRRKGGLI